MERQDSRATFEYQGQTVSLLWQSKQVVSPTRGYVGSPMRARRVPEGGALPAVRHQLERYESGEHRSEAEQQDLSKEYADA